MQLRIVVIALLLACIPACNPLTPFERREYDSLIIQGAHRQVPHNVNRAVFLNLLPGFGDFYNGEFGAFMLDFLLWPLSIAWAVPQAYYTAYPANRRRENSQDALEGPRAFAEKRAPKWVGR